MIKKAIVLDVAPAESKMFEYQIKKDTKQLIIYASKTSYFDLSMTNKNRSNLLIDKTYFAVRNQSINPSTSINSFYEKEHGLYQYVSPLQTFNIKLTAGETIKGVIKNLGVGNAKIAIYINE